MLIELKMYHAKGFSPIYIDLSRFNYTLIYFHPIFDYLY